MKGSFLNVIIINRLLLFGLFIISSACGSNDNSEAQAELNTSLNAKTTDSNIQVVRRSDLSIKNVRLSEIINNGFISGRVIPANEIQVIAEVQGILKLNNLFKAGEHFSKGELLLEIEDEAFAFALKAKKSAFLSVLAGIMPDIKADYPESYDSWFSYLTNYDTGSKLAQIPDPISDSEKFFLTSRGVYQNYFQIKADEFKLSKYQIYAPFSGSISNTIIDEGSLVSPGQILGTFISSDNFELQAAATLSVLESLQIGQKVIFYSQDLSREYNAKVLRITDIIDAATQSVVVYFSVSGKGLKSGLYLEASLDLNRFNNAYTIHKDLLSRDNNVYTIVDNTIQAKKVKVLKSSQDSIVVSGLSTNDQLILNRFNKPIQGLKVTE
jgi:multidrug efflux pump subunit AcrA (membrane-fusion protein)